MADNLAQNVARVARLLAEAPAVACLTGAGVSAESGVPTFRGAGGLWEGQRAEELATPEAFARDPERVWRFYLWRRRKLLEVRPNPAHYALARLEQLCTSFHLTTQNVDGLHTWAGSRNLIALHGDIWIDRCTRCGRESRAEMADTASPAGSENRERSQPSPPPKLTPLTSREGAGGRSDTQMQEPLPNLPLGGGGVVISAFNHAPSVTGDQPPRCAACGALCRPGVVWFGEMLPPGAFEQAAAFAEAAKVMLVVGTSGVVQPAATLAHIAQAGGATVVEINLEPSALSSMVDESLFGKAGEILPAVVAAWPDAGPPNR